MTSAVTVVLHNGAPDHGLSSQVIGDPPSSRMPAGTNRVWLSLYSPLALSGATLDGTPLHAETIGELGVYTYGAFFNIPSGATRTVTFQLHGRVDAGGYGLHVYNQPTVIPDRTTVEIGTDKTGTQGTINWIPTGQSSAYRFFSFPG